MIFPTTPDTDVMRRAAEAATFRTVKSVYAHYSYYSVWPEPENGTMRVADVLEKEDAAHIAASCPTNVLAVLDRLAAAKAALAEREKQVADLCAALKPFAEAANLFFECDGLIAFSGTEISIGDLRRAATTLASIRAAAGRDRDAT